MRALSIRDGELILESDRPTPIPPKGSVRVQVLQAGICETDLQLVAGYMGFQGVLGHEFVGIAETGTFAGQRVVGEINCVCNACDMCQRGLGNHCLRRTVIGIFRHDGAFADYVIVPEANLHRVPDTISNDCATLVEPVAAALQISQQVSLAAGMQCYIVGDGRLGNLCAQVVKGAGCQVTVIGKHADKLATFADLGFATCLLDDVAKQPKADLVVDCAGAASGLATALSLVRPRGTVVMKTTVAVPHTLDMSPIVIDEISLVGSRCGPFDKAIDALQQRRFDLNGFISGRYRLDDYQQAFRRATDQDAMKVILEVT